MSSLFALALGQRLRAVRREHGLTLKEVEKRSGGRWKAVTISAYERADRAVTITNLVDLADFYEVPVGELLPVRGSSARRRTRQACMIIDLERLAHLTDEDARPLVHYASAVRADAARPDGDVLHLDTVSLRLLAKICGLTPAELTGRFIEWNVLIRHDSPERELVGQL